MRNDPDFAPEIERWSTYIGQGAIRFYLPLNVQLANPFFAQAVIVSKDIDARERLQSHLERLLREEFPEVVGRVSPLELGPRWVGRCSIASWARIQPSCATSP